LKLAARQGLAIQPTDTSTSFQGGGCASGLARCINRAVYAGNDEGIMCTSMLVRLFFPLVVFRIVPPSRNKYGQAALIRNPVSPREESMTESPIAGIVVIADA
jgi:hypothetical protein